MNVIPEGGFVWEKGSEIEVNSFELSGKPHFYYKWQSQYCRRNYRCQIPCNTEVRYFDAHMQRSEMLLDHAKSTGNMKSVNYLRKLMDNEIEEFKQKCTKKKLFY